MVSDSLYGFHIDFFARILLNISVCFVGTMGGVDESQYKFTGINKYFNTYTQRGRLNVSFVVGNNF